MNEEEYLQKCLNLLDYFGKDYSKDTIEIHSGDLSCIANPKSQFYQTFGGHSIRSVATYVATKLDKKIVWTD